MSSPSAPKRGTAGKFSTRMRNDEILAEILVAKFAAADLNEELTEAFFDRLRSRDCPTAEHTVKRLKLSWAELVEMCEQPLTALRLSALRHRRADPEFVSGATPEEARWALRLVGRRLGCQRRVKTDPPPPFEN